MTQDDTWMSDEPRFFSRIRNKVQALRVTDDNVKSVARWCGGEALPNQNPNKYVANDDPILRFPTLEGVEMIFVGDWIIKSEDGRFSKMDNLEFRQEFKYESRGVEPVFSGNTSRKDV